MSIFIEQLLQELATELDMAPLSFNKEGHCSLLIDENLLLDIELQSEQERLIFTSLVGQVQSSEYAGLLSQLMQLNMALYKEYGMCLSLEAHTNSIVLTHSVSVRGISVFDLQNILSLFICQAEKCSVLVEQYCNDTVSVRPTMSSKAICV